MELARFRHFCSFYFARRPSRHGVVEVRKAVVT
jgi:hypothetical protein